MRQHHPEGEALGRAEAILHDPPIKKRAPFGRFFRFCCIYLLFKSTMHLAFKIVIKPGLYRYEIQPAQRTRSDRKDSKSVIHDTLGPLRPWSGTLSSSDRVPCTLNSFITVRFSRMMVCQQIGSFLWRFIISAILLVQVWVITCISVSILTAFSSPSPLPGSPRYASPHSCARDARIASALLLL